MKEQSTVNLQKKRMSPYKQCLNCGASLRGVYCHECGQQVSGFLLYFYNCDFYGY